MGFFDRFKSKPAVAPPQRKRQFLAANIDRLNSQFVSSNTPIDYDLYSQGRVLIARARYLSKNNEFARRYLSIVTNNVVGPKGIQLQAKVQRAGGPYKAGSDALEAAWADFGRKGNCDVTSQYSFCDIERIAIEGVKRDGETFINLLDTGKHGLKVQIIDPLLVPVELNEKLRNGNTIVMGVELTAQREPVAYYVSTSRKELSPSVYSFDSRRYERIEAANMLHLMHPDFVNQTRGYTSMSAAIPRMHMLQKYDEATLVGARVAASSMLFYIDAENTAGYTGDEEVTDYEYAEDIEPGVARRLPHGASVSTFDPKQPTTTYPDFAKWCLRAIASALNISYHTLSQDYESATFSSARSATLEDRDLFRADQEWLIRELHQLIYDRWLPRAILNGQIVIKGQPVSMTRVGEFEQVSWQPRRWSWVDPLKDTSAANMSVEMKTRSISSIIREAGNDPEDVFTEIAAEREMLKKLGIELVFSKDNKDGQEADDTKDD